MFIFCILLSACKSIHFINYKILIITKIFAFLSLTLLQPLQTLRDSIKEPCEAVGSSLAWTLRELGDSIMKMRRCQSEASIVPKLKSARLELSQVVPIAKTVELENADVLPIACFLFSLMKMVEKLEEMSKEVEGIGEPAGFR